MIEAEDQQTVAQLRAEVETLRSQRDQAWVQLTQIRRSWAWRLTWPLRRAARLGRR